jgi:hypothetical protein
MNRRDGKYIYDSWAGYWYWSKLHEGNKRMKHPKNWEDQFDEVLDSSYKDYFGCNCEIPKSFLKKIANYGGLEIIDHYSIRISLPPEMSNAREKILMLLLLNSPLPTECSYHKKKNQLTVEWHY